MRKNRVIIIGGGPAGLSAAIYARRAGMDCTIIEKTGYSGGQVLYTEKVDNYPGMPEAEGMHIAEMFRRQASELGTEFVKADVTHIANGDDGVGVVLKLADGACMETDNVVIATGARRRSLAVPGEDRLRGYGVSYCATCDGAFYKDKTVCVVGGGDSAISEALYLSNICSKVYLIHRRSYLRAASSGQERIKAASNIELLLNTVVMAVEGKDMVASVRLHNVVTGNIMEKAVDGVFVAIGMEPVSELVRDVDDISCDSSGCIIAGEDGRTGMPHVYVAGDVRTKAFRQIVTAASDGANCIHSIEEDAL